jgi:hypothetical protein
MNAVGQKQIDPDDPFGPPDSPREVLCIHCWKRYGSEAIRWDGVSGVWSCATPGCGGVGYGFDIQDAPAASAGQG